MKNKYINGHKSMGNNVGIVMFFLFENNFKSYQGVDPSTFLTAPD
jgi:hypothetical protein